jgi:hypothetical protein
MRRIQRFRIQPIKFLLAWVAANLIGGFLVGYLEENGWPFMATLIFSGAIIGSLQWTVLRWLGIRDWWWPLASAIGWIFGIHLSIGLQPAVNCLVNGLWHQFGMGEVFWLNLINLPVWLSFMAILQGCLLSCHTRFRARSFRIWMLASWLGAAVNGAIGAWLCQLMCQVLPKVLIGLVNGTGWAAYGIVTGVALLWIFMGPPATEKNL